MEYSTQTRTYCVFNQSRESFLSLGVTKADNHLARLKGLLGRLKLRSDEGLWVVPSRGIHTMGLLFPIDLIYLDGQHRVVDVVEHLGTFRIGPLRIESASVLELPTRTIYSSQTTVGDQLLISSGEAMEEYLKQHPLRENRTLNITEGPTELSRDRKGAVEEIKQTLCGKQRARGIWRVTDC